MNSKRTAKIVGWVLSVLIAVVFLLTGISKLTGNEMIQSQFSGWGYSVMFMYAIGVVEVLSAIALLIPGTVVYATGALGAVMLGATYTHLIHDSIFQVLRPLLFLGALYAIFRLRKRQS